ncbi:putative DNA modification/repair radical SAM protein [Youxingia wuxianensis]|uniref:DNA modification/repair radical SAM protein n=1 Tax=Youxingia wuxianensis TaxID=2763678 RepID=A0A926IGD6_9FIRM|nr:putative DNA modification/repair radical SAM protein [Youxingia wuxianensis]MBC8584131.1 putative DNA modification/repair radical SAM protein [Youxingia wuxianensis]
MDLLEKLQILADSAKYDVACTSSGVDRGGVSGKLGNTISCGICHTFSSDGRCVSLLKVLMTNYCIYNCQYCVNRRTNDVPRTAFSPRELADLTINFYKRNYIEGLFLSSGIIKNPDYTCEKMIKVLQILRREYQFNGYIHVKAIPGADSALIEQLGILADRMSVNIELPSQQSLRTLAPDKSKESILTPMKQIRNRIYENSTEIVKYRYAPRFAPAGQSTQMIVGATPDTDYQILHLTEGLYKNYRLKRVFFSAYVPVADNPLLPSVDTKPPLLREHRLYQADWLLRFYGFEAKELLDEKNPNFNPLVDPKCNWALNHLELFPVEINTAPREMLLRIPGIGVASVKKILTARRTGTITFEGLRKIGAVLKRAQYFITCNGKLAQGLKITQDGMLRCLLSGGFEHSQENYEQLSLFSPAQVTQEDVRKCLTGQM